MNSTQAESPFSLPTYRTLFAAHCTALIGSGISTIALALLAIEIAPERASIVLGTALAIKMVVYVLVAPFAAQIGAKMPAKTLLITLDMVRAVVMVVMPWIVHEAQIYSAIAVISAASALFTPTYQALLPSVVANERAYLKALSWAQVASSVEQIASPLLAAMLLAILTFSDLFFVNAATFALSAGLIGLSRLTRTSPSSTTAARPGWGISAYLKTPRLRAVAFAYVGIAGASAMIIVNTAVYVQQHLGRSETAMSMAFAACGLGTALGALLVPRLPISPRGFLVGGNLLLACAILSGALLASWPMLLLLWLFVGVGLGLAQTPVGTVVRRSSQARHRAAFFAANFTVSHACWLATYLLAGWLGANADWRTTFFVMGSLPLLAAVACLLTYPQPDDLVVEHRHGSTVHKHPFFIDETHPNWPR